MGCVMRIGRADFASLGLGEIRIIEAPVENLRLQRQRGCFVTRFSPGLLGERGLFNAPCFAHADRPEIYCGERLLSEEYLFPPEDRDPLRKIAKTTMNERT